MVWLVLFLRAHDRVLQGYLYVLAILVTLLAVLGEANGWELAEIEAEVLHLGSIVIVVLTLHLLHPGRPRTVEDFAVFMPEAALSHDDERKDDLLTLVVIHVHITHANRKRAELGAVLLVLQNEAEVVLQALVIH